MKHLPELRDREYGDPAPAAEEPGAYPALARLQIEITYRCPRRCAYCVQRGVAEALYGDLAEASRQELSADEWLGLIDQAGDLGVPWLNISGGEPLLRRDLPALIARASTHGIRTAVPTKRCPAHGQLEKLARAGLDVIGIGLDSHVPEVADALVGQDGYFAACLASIRSAKALGIQVMLLPVITRVNVTRFPDYLTFAAELGVDVVRPQIYDPRPMLHQAYPRGADPALRSKLGLAQPETVLRVLRRLTSPLLESEDAQPDTCRGYPTHCAIGKGTMTVRPDGKVYFCPLMADLVVGDVRTQSLETIWYRGAMRSLLLPHRASYAGTACHGCARFDACTATGRCPARCVAEHGSAFAPDPLLCTAP